jgi:dienelactone hydrolase
MLTPFNMNPIKPNRLAFILAGFLLILMLASCTEPTKAIKDKNGAAVSLQQINNNQKGLVDSSLNYSFYLSKTYNGKDKLPVIFFFDPHANGKLPLNYYKALAEKYGYIFIASNQIKNGLPANSTTRIFESLLREAKQRFAIDENRMFTAGFSGGAKLAILFAQQYREIIGVIACGASLPMVPDHEPTYYYAGIIGNQDFNYLESNQTFSVFDQKGYDYTSVVFDGVHAWAPKDAFDFALNGLDVFCMKSKRLDKDDIWLDKLWKQMQDSLTAQASRNDLFAQHQTLRQASRWFYGLKSIKEIRQNEMALQNNPEFVTLIRKKQRLLKKEIGLRSEFIRAIELRDLDWWNTEIANINKSVDNPDKEIALVSHRLLNYISMASFMLTKTDLDDGKLDEANKKIQIYKLVDPENPDAYLMAARYFLQMENTEAMLEQFKKAQALGFSDYDTYKKDASWATLFNQKEILEFI